MPASALQVGNLDTLGIAALSSHTCNDDRSNRVRRRFHIQDSILMSYDPLRITRRGAGAACAEYDLEKWVQAWTWGREYSIRT